MITKILLAGDGGQGIQLIADVISHAAIDQGLEVTSIPNYGLEQRGGVSLAFIKISDKEIVYPKFSTPDILLILSDQARERTKQFQSDGVNILDVNNFKEILEDEKIKKQSYNIFFLGMLTRMLSERKLVDSSFIEKFLEKKLSKKLGWEENKRAFELDLKTQVI